MASATDIIDGGIQNAIAHGGFRPELYTVAPASYASNHIYGSGVPLINNYNTVTIQQYSSASIRQHDRSVDYNIKILLNLDAANPVNNIREEIRIQTFQPLASGEPGRYLKNLPIKDVNYRQPLFLNVEIINPATGAPFAGFPANAGIGQLQARLLIGGELAIVVSDITAGPPPTVTPLTAGDLALLFGAAAGTQLQISIRGTYRGQNQSR